MPRDLQRHQQRAVDAYAAVDAIADTAVLDDYKIAVLALGANILRSGLAGAMAVLERASAGATEPQPTNQPTPGQTAPAQNAGRNTRATAVMALREHLASAGIPGLPANTTGANLPAKIRNLSVDNYILATRETLQVVLWLRRAVQARKV